MPKPKPPAATVFPWLKANLGPRALAPLTGTDSRALQAAVQIIELYSHHRVIPLLSAFGSVVQCMQPSTRHLAYHSIAMVMDWRDRSDIWISAGLNPILDQPSKCAYEPGGSAGIYSVKAG